MERSTDPLWSVALGPPLLLFGTLVGKRRRVYGVEESFGGVSQG